MRASVCPRVQAPCGRASTRRGPSGASVRARTGHSISRLNCRMWSSWRWHAPPESRSRTWPNPECLVHPKRPTYNRAPFRARTNCAEPHQSFEDRRSSLLMAWNQPGGPNKQPWGRRPNGGGSNLDERVKDWQRRFESLFRPGGKGGEGGSLIVTVVLLVVALWLASGFFQVKAAERAVIQRFGKLVTPLRSEGWGWRWPWPIETVTKVNVESVRSSDFKSRVLTSDINLVDLRFAVQYRYAEPIKKLFKVADPESTLREVSEASIREVIGRSKLDDVLIGATRP